ncbi:MAG: hypothetical protein AMJ75_07565 [Phycisphaerae bacterium SM1_79]|nr:MAG: hypothetical protein AMJ75_07565 [Phycisphaerae bacterium SM1_79]
MRVRTKISIAIIAACVGLTIYEIPNARLNWRHSRTVIGDEKLLEDYIREKSAGTGEAVKLDLEALDMVRYCLGDPNEADLANLAARYPENEFFLGQLADTLTRANLVDPRTALAVVDRLAALNCDNAHYGFMRGLILLSEPDGPERERLALDQFKLSNDLAEFYLPYSKYKQRLELLCESIPLSPTSSKVGELTDRSLYHLLYFDYLRSRGKSLVQLDRDLLYSLLAEISDIGARLINQSSNDLLVERGTFTLLIVEPLRLREFDLPENEAEQARLRLSQALAMMPLLRRTGTDRDSLLVPLAIAAVLGSVALQVLPLLFIIWVFVVVVNRKRGWDTYVWPTIWMHVFFVGGLLGMFGLLILLGALDEYLRGGYVWGFLFIGVAVVVWGLMRLLSRLRPADPARFRRARKWAAAVCGPLWAFGIYPLFKEEYPHQASAGLSEWLELFASLAVWSAFWTIIWAVAAHRHHVFRVIPWDRVLRSRFMRLSLVLVLMTGIIWLLKFAPAAAPIVVLFTILLVGLVSSRASEDLVTSARVTRRFFQRDSEIVITRSRIESMVAAVLVVSWLAVLAANDLCAAKVSMLSTLLMDPLSPYRPLPEATLQTYERVILGADNGELAAYESPQGSRNSDKNKNLHFASPEDTSRTIAERQAAGKPLDDKELGSLLRQCGRDVRPVILNALQDPNTISDSLRGEWGDRTVKKQLERVFEEGMTALVEGAPVEVVSKRGPSRLESQLNLAATLACLSDPQEAEDRFSRLLEPVVQKARNKPEKVGLFEEFTAETLEARSQARQRSQAYHERRSLVRSFWESLAKLPKPHATNLFKSYLQRTQFVDLSVERDVDEIANFIGRLSDRELAEQIFEKVAESPPTKESYDIPIGEVASVFDRPLPRRREDTSHVFLEAVFPHLTAESISLLLEHLGPDNDQLRAFIVWRVTSLGYEWSEEQLAALRQDGYWKVRLNALFACDADDLRRALDDENAFVRIIARMLIQADQKSSRPR